MTKAIWLRNIVSALVEAMDVHVKYTRPLDYDFGNSDPTRCGRLIFVGRKE